MHYAVNELIQETKTTYSLHSSTGMTNANCILVRTPHCTQNVGVSWAKEEANMELTFEFYGTDVSSKNSYVAFTSTTSASATAVAANTTTVTNATTSAADAHELHVSFSETLMGQ